MGSRWVVRRPSRFNVLVDVEPHRSVLYNTLRGSLTVLEGAEIRAVERALSGGEVRWSSAHPDELLVALEGQGHLVPVDFDELALIEDRKRLGVTDPNRLDLIVMPTLSCNFACRYCYETKHASHMSDRVGNALESWLTAEVPKAKLVVLHWFGGEPLLETRRVVAVTRHLHAVAAEAQVATSVHVTTNGYLLDGWRRQALLEAGIVDYQITVDGPARTHDHLRPLRSGGPTYARVVRNLEEVVRGDPSVWVTLRVNFNHTNIAAISDLFHAIAPDVRSRARVVLEPVFGSDEHSATGNLGAEAISAWMADCYREAEALGFDVGASVAGMRTGKLVYCYAERDKQLIVNYNGDVFKCSVGSFDAADRVGRLADDGRIIPEAGAWERWAKTDDLFAERCRTCAYLPLCMGGCRKMRLTQHHTGSFCALVPTNASYLLKQIAFSGFDVAARDRAVVRSVAAEQPVELRREVRT